MRSRRTLLAAAGIVATLAACGGDSPIQPAGEAPQPTSRFSVVDDAQDVADQLEQRQAELEEQLRDPFSER